MAALADLLAQLDPDPHRRGRQFERVCQWFLAHDPVYAHELRHKWLWKGWPGRWGADAGIDLVAEDRHGHLWAIQAKAYDQRTWITKRDVDTFLAESGRSEFSFRLLIATTNLIGRTAKRTIEAQEKQASVLLLGDLETAEVDWPASPFDLRHRRLPPKRPRPHQREAINAVVKGFNGTDRGQLIMASGTGKTLTALFIREKLAADRTLVLVPSLSLLAQTLRVWTANARVGFDFLPVCSDETVAEPDAVVSNTSDLGFPVTTDAEEIAAFLRRRSGPCVVFATYQSSPEIAKALRLGRVPAFDLAIADEAHRCAGRVSSDFATILDAEDIPARRRLFMTATPRYFTGRIVREAKEADFEVASMDDEAAFGPVLHRLGFAEAIERDLLTDYQVVVVGVDNATYRDWAQRGRFVTLDGTKVTDARTLAGQIGLAKAMRRYDLHRTITFHSRVKRAREFAHSLPEVIAWMPARQRPKGHLWSDFASGEMSAGKRQALLQHLGRLNHDKRGLLASARCLTEGIDVPTLDGVAFIDPRRSEVDIVQAVGRAIRLAPDKTVGTIVIPVFIDTDEDPEIALEDSAFKPVWDVTKALRSQDEELGEQLDELRRQLGRQGRRPRLPGKIILDLPATVSTDFARAFDVRLVEQTTLSWEFWFGLLEKYVAVNGNTRVPALHEFKGLKLGQWVVNQRHKGAKGVLSADRRRRLESFSDWTWDAVADMWEDGFRCVQGYSERCGDSLVPQRFRSEDGYPLGAWVTSQRSDYRSGELSKERQERLEALPGWSWTPREYRWEEGFRRLQDYVKVHGDAHVVRTYTDPKDDYPLGGWAQSQRAWFAKGSLKPERVSRLERLPGWRWDVHDSRWEEAFRRLQGYAAEHGDCLVPKSYGLDGYRLGAWVQWQRDLHGEGRLNADCQRRLEALPGWSWDTNEAKWEQGFRKLVDYTEQHGDAKVPAKYRHGDYSLGSWVGTQRDRYKSQSLREDRARRLEALPGWSWDPHGERWEEGFGKLAAYVRSHGDSRVPYDHMDDGYSLGVWVGSQRSARLKGKLGKERKAQLEALPGWSWDTREDQWDDKYAALAAFTDREGHARVPQGLILNGVTLGSWVSIQRQNRDRLSQDRRERLEALPGWTWDPYIAQWEQNFELLHDYVSEHGTSRVPRSYRVGDIQLGVWVGLQRAAFAIRKLDSSRQRRLEELPGWTWDPRAERWEEHFHLICQYVEEHGDSRVPYSYAVDGTQLGAWVGTQRSDYAKGKLDPSRQHRLEELPGWTWKAR